MKFRILVLEGDSEEVMERAFQTLKQLYGPEVEVPPTKTDHPAAKPPISLSPPTTSRREKMSQEIHDKLHTEETPQPKPDISFLEWTRYPYRKAQKDLAECLICERTIRKHQEYRYKPTNPTQRAHRQCVLETATKEKKEQAA